MAYFFDPNKNLVWVLLQSLFTSSVCYWSNGRLCKIPKTPPSELGKTTEIQNSNLSRICKAANVYKVETAESDVDIKFPTQHSNQGIGFGNFAPSPTPSQERKLITAKVATFSEETRLAHTLSP